MSFAQYVNLDRVWSRIVAYVGYRGEVTRCFLSRPRIGHDWEGGGLYATCRRCPKVFIGNV